MRPFQPNPEDLEMHDMRLRQDPMMGRAGGPLGDNPMARGAGPLGAGGPLGGGDSQGRAGGAMPTFSSEIADLGAALGAHKSGGGDAAAIAGALGGARAPGPSEMQSGDGGLPSAWFPTQMGRGPTPAGGLESQEGPMAFGSMGAAPAEGAGMQRQKLARLLLNAARGRGGSRL